MKRIKVDRHPDPVIDAAIDRVATEAVQRMTPRDLGLILYPDATPIPLSEVPKNVVADHRDRYTQEDMETGQFLEVLPGKYLFIMSRETKYRKTREETSEQRSSFDF
jgi:hypothetical protein